MMIPTVLVVSFLVFVLVDLIPGNVLDAILAGDPSALEGLDRAAVEHDMGLDAPFLVRYGRWLGVVPQSDDRFSGVFQGDLGTSFLKQRSVVEFKVFKNNSTIQVKKQQ